MATIRIRLVNQSQATDNPIIAVSCTAPVPGERVVAWRLIQNIGSGSIFPFTYSQALNIVVGDSDGNYTPMQLAELGALFVMTRTPSGNQLLRSSESGQSNTVTVRNMLPNGSINIDIYRDQHVCAQIPSLYPNAQGVLSFRPMIYIGRAIDVQKGATATTVEFTDELTQINLSSYRNFDVVMRGGYAGEPLNFSVENASS